MTAPPPPEVYTTAFGGSSTLGLLARILRISPTQLSRTWSTIEDKLKTYRINMDASLNSRVARAQLARIAEEVRREEKFRSLFLVAQNRGETPENIDKAIRKYVLHIQRNRRQRASRAQNKAVRNRSNSAAKSIPHTDPSQPKLSLDLNPTTNGKSESSGRPQTNSQTGNRVWSRTQGSKYPDSKPIIRVWLKGEQLRVFRPEQFMAGLEAEAPRIPQFVQMKEELDKLQTIRGRKLDWFNAVCDLGDGVTPILDTQETFSLAYEDAQEGRKDMVIRVPDI